jgi:protein-disulfide isomerase
MKEDPTLKPMQPVGKRDHTRGSVSTEVTVVEYGDYQCTRSGLAYKMLKENWHKIQPHVHFVFRNFPVSGEHPHAQHAAEAAEAAGAQNRFWEMHDSLFEHQGELENGFILEYANALGLDTMKFLRDMAAHNYSNKVREDTEGGMLSGVSSTPTFFINGAHYNGMCDVDALLRAVEDARIACHVLLS